MEDENGKGKQDRSLNSEEETVEDDSAALPLAGGEQASEVPYMEQWYTEPAETPAQETDAALAVEETDVSEEETGTAHSLAEEAEHLSHAGDGEQGLEPEGAEGGFDESEEEDEGIDPEELSRSIEEMCLSKAQEFRMIGYEHVTGKEIWECVSDKYRKTGIPSLHRIVNDILSLKVTTFMNWLTMSIYKDAH